MSDIRSWLKEFLTEFMTIYKSETCLWKKKSKEYSNRNFKTQAYGKLTNVVKTVYPEGNREWVVNRIQSLRGSFRKELQKVQE
jgi:hypothetical protein